MGVNYIPPETKNKMYKFKKECLKLAGIDDPSAHTMRWDHHIWKDIASAIVFRQEVISLFIFRRDKEEWSKRETELLCKAEDSTEVQGFLDRHQDELLMLDNNIYGNNS